MKSRPCLNQMPGVHAVAVIVQLGERQQKLIAYLVVDKRDLNKPSIDELDVDAPVASQPQPKVNLLTVKQYVSERLPRYMVPHAVRFLPELPINANGKVDRKRLKNEGANVITPTVSRDRHWRLFSIRCQFH
ncbi:hypothetical protein P4S72_00550 [Vibrio sp. PP-XX7]